MQITKLFFFYVSVDCILRLLEFSAVSKWKMTGGNISTFSASFSADKLITGVTTSTPIFAINEGWKWELKIYLPGCSWGYRSHKNDGSDD